MRICVISSYPPEKEGVGLYSKRLVENLSKNKINVEVITFSKNKNKEVEPLLSWNPFIISKFYTKLKKFDIIHLQYAISIYRIYSLLLFIILYFFKLNNDKKIVVTFHEVKRETDKLGNWGFLYYKWISKIFNRIYVHTEQAKSILIDKCRVSDLKIKVIPHGVFEFKNKKNLTKEIRKRYGLGNKKIVLFFGYINKDKGTEYLIKAAREFYDANPKKEKEVVFLIAGSVRPRKGLFKLFQKEDLEYYTSLRDLVKKLNLKEKVIFTGYVREEETYSVFKLSEIIVLPYINVEQSGVLNWALASQRPIIASNIGGLKETLGSPGILVEPRNFKSIANKIERLLADKKYSLSIIKCYKSIISNQSTPKVIKKQIEDYKLILK